MLKNEEKWRKILEITIKAEVHIEDLEQVAISKDKANTILKYSKDERMKELNVNLKQSANYLIQLFYKTGQVYSCTRTKIGKMLSIVAFAYAKRGEKVFDETIYKYNDCGTAFLELKALVDREVYMKPAYQDDRMPVSIEYCNDIDIPDMHQSIDLLSDDIKRTIEEVFRLFGAYTADDLGKALMIIVNYPNVTNDNNEIQLSIIEQLSLTNFIDYVDDTLIKYLFL